MNRLIRTLFALMMMLIALPLSAAPATNNTTALNPNDKAQIETIVRDYLTNHPEVLVQALQVYQQRQYEQAQQTVKQTQQIASTYAKDLFQQPNDPIIGNPQGKVTLVEFFDYQCPHCVEMAPVIESLIKANPQLKIVFKEFPIRGPVSEFAARAALAANKQGKYAVFSHAILMTKQPLTEALILDLAKKVDLNPEQLKKEMNDPAITKQLKNNIQLAQNLKLFGTPALFIGKTTSATPQTIEYVPGQMDQTQLQQLIDKADK